MTAPVSCRPPVLLYDLTSSSDIDPPLVDNIESNISSVEVNVRDADRELTTAADYQRKVSSRGTCLMIIVVIVITIVLVAVRMLLFVPRYLPASSSCMLRRKAAVSFHPVSGRRFADKIVLSVDPQLAQVDSEHIEVLLKLAHLFNDSWSPLP